MNDQKKRDSQGKTGIFQVYHGTVVLWQLRKKHTSNIKRHFAWVILVFLSFSS